MELVWSMHFAPKAYAFATVYNTDIKILSR